MGAERSGYVRAPVRPEVQALRAVAVGAVVLHHGWPAVAPAGYMGVDVFFVVSGFLITGLLLREHERSGRISLSRFYLRRARRILPAAVVVLMAVSVATLLFAPRRDWFQWFREIVASALYVENWQLVADSQNPARADLASTPVQHFWSLGVEEQFYLVWPLLLILALWVAVRRGADARRTVLVALGVVTAASFASSVAATAVDHNIAYFSTVTRTWEFGVGGLLAVLTATRTIGSPQLRAAASWAGLLCIALPIVTFREPEVFPGLVVLLPVVGTLAVIWAGMPEPRWSPAAIAGAAPVQWMGDVSYSLYLWHWPIIMFAPYVTGVASPPWMMACLVVLSFAVADLSKRCIEDPFRRAGSPIATRPLALVGGLALAMALVVGAGTVAPDVVREELACERDE
ncbi:acyltransferase family protein [Agromyces sp. CFH 90414]|uniref:Acyltransferase family protein n=1 Tax=Agromyces agglutinans TaxID=2662258 RepID=A0A6I2F9K9_9MICO|nr:acyltransferase [Agromyces agglutinans]MRG61329.1 acyltransferase family protein [Agromyces agglutinans]